MTTGVLLESIINRTGQAIQNNRQNTDMKTVNHKELALALIQTVLDAGRVEMEVYRGEIEVETKDDSSPVTIADKAAEEIILRDLANIEPEIPVLAEEAVSEGIIPEIGDQFFLVDPLDGTKEFIKKSDEFTVNIALIENGIPVFGIVYAPATEKLFVTLGEGEACIAKVAIDKQFENLEELNLKILKTKQGDPAAMRVVASKSHMTNETKSYLEKLNVAELVSAGSSLKFCMLAEGLADIYPRFGPTMEWDTAAGHAVLIAAGGTVVLEDGSPFIYGKTEQKYLNPYFIAHAKCQTGTHHD